jgi:hypothetical protein
MGLTARNCIGQELELITNSAVMLSEPKQLWSISVPRRFKFDLRFFASLRMTRCECTDAYLVQRSHRPGAKRGSRNVIDCYRVSR